MTSLDPQTQNPFLRALTSSDLETRTSALQSLRQFLCTRDQNLSYIDHLKLQKGLFYAIYMSDKPRPQQTLCLTIASLVYPLPGSIDTDNMGMIRNDEVALDFQKGFWESICKEWKGIDRLRMDKYLLCMRVVFRAGLLRVKNQAWESAKLQRWCDLISQGPMHATSLEKPDAIRYHLLDLWVDEIETVLEGADDAAVDIGDDVLRSLMQPIEEMSTKSPNKTVRTRAREVLLDERLTTWRGGPVHESENDPRATEGSDDDWEGFEE